MGEEKFAGITVVTRGLLHFYCCYGYFYEVPKDALSPYCSRKINGNKFEANL